MKNFKEFINESDETEQHEVETVSAHQDMLSKSHVNKNPERQEFESNHNCYVFIINNGKVQDITLVENITDTSNADLGKMMLTAQFMANARVSYCWVPKNMEPEESYLLDHSVDLRMD